MLYPFPIINNKFFYEKKTTAQMYGKKRYGCKALRFGTVFFERLCQKVSK